MSQKEVAVVSEVSVLGTIYPKHDVMRKYRLVLAKEIIEAKEKEPLLILFRNVSDHPRKLP